MASRRRAPYTLAEIAEQIRLSDMPGEYIGLVDAEVRRYYPNHNDSLGHRPRAIICSTPWDRADGDRLWYDWEVMRSAAEQLTAHGWYVRFRPDKAHRNTIVIRQGGQRLPALVRSPAVGDWLMAAADYMLIQVGAPTFYAAWQASDTLDVIKAPDSSADEGAILLSVDDSLDDLIQGLAKRPEDVFKMSPRTFEELVAELLTRQGLEVQLTPAMRDGGRDILARAKGVLGTHLYLVECKRFAPGRPVGVGLVRALYGVIEHERSTAGMLITTSSFTRGAVDFSSKVSHRLSLGDYYTIREWLSKV